MASMLSTSNSHPGQPAARLDRANESPVTGVRRHPQQQQEEQHELRENIPSTKRRRLRKGTRSCWECKRRKARCLFARPDCATCIGCQHRRTPCVSQEMSEDLSPAQKGNGHLRDRVARIEEAMKDWLAGQAPGSSAAITQGVPLETPSKPLPRLTPSHLPSNAAHRDLLTPVESLAEPASHASPVFLNHSGHGYGNYPSEVEATARSHLVAALPSPSDARILLQERRPRSRLTPETLATIPPPPQVEVLFGSHWHPVLLAKQMLLFAITLQCPCGEEVLGLSEPSSVLMQCLTTAATMWVTTRHEMQGTLDALICIILEGIFQTNAGNLQPAWAVYRRALAVAQLMGLHRSPCPPLPRIDAMFEADPQSVWFRIVYMDRYLSLLLGLPQGTTDQSMGSPAVLQAEPPLGQFERHLTVLASQILKRNDATFIASSEIAATQALNAELLAVSESMPSTFWRPVNFYHLTPGAPETLLETVRLGVQVYYHGLLIHLHLPYMMHGMKGHPSNRTKDRDNPALRAQHDSSKITCVNSSREIMARFIAHRTFNPVSACSRPVDFFALLAAMTLLLAHLDAHHDRGGMAANCLAHQRLSDRAMLDQALERMDLISHLNRDDTARQSATLIRRLLDIEAGAARGNRDPTGSRGGVPGSGSRASDAGSESGHGYDLLRSIPYLNTIWNVRDGPLAQEPCPASAPVSPPCASPTADAHSHISAQGTSTLPADTPAPPPDDLTSSTYQEPSMLPYSTSSAATMVLQQPVGLLNSAAGVNDWALQGVDMAFFDGLMRGTSSIDLGGVGQ